MIIAAHEAFLDDWTRAATIGDGRMFRCASRKGAVWGSGITEKDCGRR